MRILVLCLRDWRHPRASAASVYTHEVFRRIAARGHEVSWLAHRWRPGLSRGAARPRIEQADGLQVARLGLARFFTPMAGLVVRRVVGGGPFQAGGPHAFAAVVDCVEDVPRPVHRWTTRTPVLPIVFRVDRPRGLHATQGPVVAATGLAQSQLADAGVPPNQVICAPFGYPESPGGSGPQPAAGPSILAVTRKPALSDNDLETAPCEKLV